MTPPTASEGAFTPGPWSYSKEHDTVYSDVSAHICSMVPEAYADLGKLEANAQLIASAPQMHADLTRHREELARLRTSHGKLVDLLAWIESTAINLHCALQSTAHMDPNDGRIPVITGQVIRDLLVMRNHASNAQATAASGEGKQP
jgi:hypothetical protein